jgi:hypothetical protein
MYWQVGKWRQRRTRLSYRLAATPHSGQATASEFLYSTLTSTSPVDSRSSTSVTSQGLTTPRIRAYKSVSRIPRDYAPPTRIPEEPGYFDVVRFVSADYKLVKTTAIECAAELDGHRLTASCSEADRFADNADWN